MPTIVPRRNRDGRLIGYQAKVRKAGHTISKTFRRHADAERWGREIETDIQRAVFVDRRPAERMTLGAALEKYRLEVTPDKKSAERERKRIDMWLADPLSRRPLATLEMADFYKWKQERRRQRGRKAKASVNTIRLDLAVIRQLFNHLPNWKIKGLENPISGLDLGKVPRGRDRRLVGDEEERLLAACDASSCKWLGPFVRLLIETAMRRGELLGLAWDRVDLKERIAYLPDTKTGEPREVPLSTRAKLVLSGLRRTASGDVFPITENTLKNAFERACRKAKIVNLRMHDLRHEATSRLFENTTMRDSEVAFVTGHKTLAMLKRYTHLRAKDIRHKLP
jgi:integrase